MPGSVHPPRNKNTIIGIKKIIIKTRIEIDNFVLILTKMEIKIDVGKINNIKLIKI
jgi:hypothetical protein